MSAYHQVLLLTQGLEVFFLKHTQKEIRNRQEQLLSSLTHPEQSCKDQL